MRDSAFSCLSPIRKQARASNASPDTAVDIYDIFPSSSHTTSPLPCSHPLTHTTLPNTPLARWTIKRTSRLGKGGLWEEKFGGGFGRWVGWQRKRMESGEGERRGWWPPLVPETYLPVAGSVNMHPVLSNNLSSWPPSRGGRAAAVAATEVESTSAQRCSLPQMVQKNRCWSVEGGGIIRLRVFWWKKKNWCRAKPHVL